MRGLLLGALLLGGSTFAADDELSGGQAQMIMSTMEPLFTTLTVCVNGKCSAAYECGNPPSFHERPDGSIRIYTDCDADEVPEFRCANGALLRVGDWCQFNYENGTYFRVTMLSDGFTIEDMR
jgi:hypothetical protein